VDDADIDDADVDADESTFLTATFLSACCRDEIDALSAASSDSTIK
jgi:hypothetical protein